MRHREGRPFLAAVHYSDTDSRQRLNKQRHQPQRATALQAKGGGETAMITPGGQADHSEGLGKIPRSDKVRLTSSVRQ